MTPIPERLGLFVVVFTLLGGAFVAVVQGDAPPEEVADGPGVAAWAQAVPSRDAPPLPSSPTPTSDDGGSETVTWTGVVSDATWTIAPGGDCTAPSCSSLRQLGPRAELVLVFPENTETVVLAMHYEPQSPLARLSMNVYCWGNDGSDCLHSGGTGTHQTLRIDRDAFDEHGFEWAFDVRVVDAVKAGDVGLGAAFQQRVQITMTVFYAAE